MDTDKCSWILGQIDAYCFMVSRGKPAAQIMIPRELGCLALEAVHSSHDCYGFIEEAETDGEWCNLWIYKRPFMLEIIQARRKAEKYLPAALGFWLAGCLFGYSQEEIESGWESRYIFSCKKMYSGSFF